MQNLQTGWFFSDLGEYRPMPDWGTYYCFPYEELPELPAISFDGSFAWLLQGEPLPVSDEDKLLETLKQAKNAGFELPNAFLRFMGDENLRRAVESVSCTACFFELTAGLVPIPNSTDEYVVHFLSDQQYCLLWYLYIKDGKDAGVLVSPDVFGPDGLEENGKWPACGERFLLSAPNFEQFMYRFWLENELWNKVAYGNEQALNPIEKAYLDHYSQLKTID